MSGLELKPGDFYLTRIAGPTGVFITIAQWLIGDLSRYAHAGIYVGGGEVAEAMPGGLQINPLSKYNGKEFVHSRFELSDLERANICTLARSMEGTPYSYWGYLYLGLNHFKRCPKWLKKKVSNSTELSCGQFVVYAYDKGGEIDLLSDERIYLDVTPGDLARLTVEGRLRDQTTPTLELEKSNEPS